jgi:hypothetical protein
VCVPHPPTLDQAVSGGKNLLFTLIHPLIHSPLIHRLASALHPLQKGDGPAAKLVRLFRNACYKIRNHTVMLNNLKQFQSDPNFDLPPAPEPEQQDDDEVKVEEEEDEGPELEPVAVLDEAVWATARTLRKDNATRYCYNVLVVLLCCAVLTFIHIGALCSCCRWNSVFLLLERMVEVEAAVRHSLANSQYANDATVTPTDADWAAAHQLCRFLQPFQEATDFLQGEHYPTLGGVSRYLYRLYHQLSQEKAPSAWRIPQPVTKSLKLEDESAPPPRPRWSDCAVVVQELRGFIAGDMNTRWLLDAVEPDVLLGVAAAVHPGHKSLSWLSPHARDAIHSAVRVECFNVADMPVDPDPAPAPAPAPAVAPAAAPAPAPAAAPEQNAGKEEAAAEPAAKRQKAASLLWAEESDDDGDQPMPAAPPVAPADDDAARRALLEQELVDYWLVPEIGFQQHRTDPAQDPLLWWARNEGVFPHVAKLAKKYLAIPASSAPSERVFSATKLQIEGKRYRLLPSHLSQQVFVRLNAPLLGLQFV